MFDVAERRARDRRDVFRPFPAGFVTRAPDRHPADSDNVEPTFLKHAGLVRLLKSLQNYFEHSFPFSNAGAVKRRPWDVA
jgi:hypothetical protein